MQYIKAKLKASFSNEDVVITKDSKNEYHIRTLRSFNGIIPSNAVEVIKKQKTIKKKRKSRKKKDDIQLDTKPTGEDIL